MNATLQCLLHTPMLRGYFSRGDFLKDVDDGSALNVAMAYGALAFAAFGSDKRAISPRLFKKAVAAVSRQLRDTRSRTRKSCCACW